MDNQSAVAARQLAKFFRRGRREFAAVHFASFDVAAGSVCAVLGRNGAGKTTLLRMLAGVLEPDHGQATVLGYNCQSLPASARNEIAWVPESASFELGLPIKRVIRLHEEVYTRWDSQLCHRMLDTFGLNPRSLPAALSEGQRVLFALSMALSYHPRLLILDDLSTRLDIVVRRKIVEQLVGMVSDEKMTILLSSHILTEIERIAEHVVFLREGLVVAADQLDAVKSSTRRLIIADPGLSLPDIPEILRVRRKDDGVVCDIRNWTPDVDARLSSAGIHWESCEPIPFEDVFIAYTEPKEVTSNE